MTKATQSQRAAIDARGNVLVVAGAGTGKTSTVVQRCLAFLEEGCSLENILMVTFTDAAAAEMRHRIRGVLRQRVDELSADSSALPEQGLKEHLEKQLALLDTSNISTLHGFCLELVREHFYELGIDPNVIVLDEQQTQPLIQRTLDAVFDRHYAGETESSQAVQSLVRVHGRGLDDHIKGLVLKLHRYSQSLANPKSWVDEQLALFQKTEPTKWREWFVEGVLSWKNLWLSSLETRAGTPAVDMCLKVLKGIRVNDSFSKIAAAVNAIKDADDDENWPRGSIKNVRDHLKKFFADVDYLSSLTPGVGDDPLVEDWELVRRHLIALLFLLAEFTAEFSRAKRELGGVDFSDLEQFALRLLRGHESGALTQIAFAWRDRLRHVFVDEYQDINAAQDAIVAALSREGAEANRFLVGDIKQSIYRFRLSDPTIFRGYEMNWKSATANAQCLSLTENFRSHESLLDFFNSFFGMLMHRDFGAVLYEPLAFGNPSERKLTARNESAPPRVELHLILKSDAANGDIETDGGAEKDRAEVSDLFATEREARVIALRLRDLYDSGCEIWDKDAQQFRRIRWSDMAVLLRSPAGRAEAFAMEFHRFGVPLEAARGGFFQSTEISDLLCLLKIIDNPIQDIPLLAVLRSPLVGLSIDEFAEVRAHNTEPNFWRTLQRFNREIESSESERPAVKSACKKTDLFLRQFENWRELIRQTSLSHCLETALRETHYEDLLKSEPRGDQRAANVRRLIDLARQYDPYQRQGLFRFLRFVCAQEETEVDLEPAPSSGGDAVRLMSIHKSKGLEFPVVVLAGMGWQFNLQDLREDILLDEKFGLCPKITPPDGEQQYPSLPHWLGTQRKRRELLEEEMRLLYVAMTRARDWLILSGASSKEQEPRHNAPSEMEIFSARNYLDWLQLWLGRPGHPPNSLRDGNGRSEFLNATLYSEDDARLAPPKHQPLREPAGPSEAIDEISAQKLCARISWSYPFHAATQHRAKSSVTALRRERNEEDDEAGTIWFGQGQEFRTSIQKKPAMASADIGIAHHRFLQKINLKLGLTATDLEREAKRMFQCAWLSKDQLDVLDFGALENFWRSTVGKQILEHADCVKRELPFTARFSVQEIDEILNLEGNTTNQARALVAEATKESPVHNSDSAFRALSGNDPTQEFVVVQGVVDLAVILPNEIFLLDFKTDDVNPSNWEEKARTYRPQLLLYELALARIYRRPISNSWLHFLKIGQTVSPERISP